MKQLTKLEIMAETYEAYKNPQNRAYDDNLFSCRYLMGNGKMCAVGRCMTPKYLDKLGTASVSVDDLFDEYGDEFLRLEYQGHEPDFWSDLQIWHDRSDHFNNQSVSRRGNENFKKLVERWDV